MQKAKDLNAYEMHFTAINSILAVIFKLEWISNLVKKGFFFELPVSLVRS